MFKPAASVSVPVHVGKYVAKQLESAAAHAITALLERHVRAAGKGDVAEHRELAVCHQHGLHEQAVGQSHRFCCLNALTGGCFKAQ